MSCQGSGRLIYFHANNFPPDLELALLLQLHVLFIVGQRFGLFSPSEIDKWAWLCKYDNVGNQPVIAISTHIGSAAAAMMNSSLTPLTLYNTIADGFRLEKKSTNMNSVLKCRSQTKPHEALTRNHGLPQYILYLLKLYSNIPAIP